MKKNSLRILSVIIAGSVVIPTAARASASLCDAASGNLVQNCGFESDMQGSIAPMNWAVNPAFTDSTFNYVVEVANSGNNGLRFGNLDAQPAPTISQTFSDTLGATYNVSFYLAYGGGTSDPNAYFDAQIDNSTLASFNNSLTLSYALEKFTFTGMGSDTLTFTGNTDPNDWYLDDIVVTPAAVPLPASAWLMLSGVIGVFAMVRKQRAA